jgi:pSer/pThr/pTyr-binding forkhead associated (FHA) protein
MAFLYHLEKDGSVAQFWEVSEGPLLVGRGDFAGACIADESLSRAHFLILREAKEFFVVDLESQNGTWMNGVPISGHRLHEGDIIRAGESSFQFSRQSPTVQPQLMPYALPSPVEEASSTLGR